MAFGVVASDLIRPRPGRFASAPVRAGSIDGSSPCYADTMRIVSAAGAALVFVAGCATPFSTWNPETFASVRVATLPPLDDQPARLLLNEKVLRFEEVDGVVVAREFNRTKVRVQGPQGQGFRDAVVGHDRTFTTVEAFDARVTMPDGTVRTFTDKDIVDVPMLGTYMLYSDNRIRRLQVPEVPRGAVVEVASVTRTTQPELFAYVQTFGAPIPVDAARFVIESPMAWSIEVLAEKAGEVVDWPAQETLRDGWRRLAWEAKDIAPLLPDADAPSFGELVDRVTVRLQRAVTSSGEVVEGPRDAIGLSKMTAALTAPSVRDTPALRKIVTEVLGPDPGSLPPKDRAAKLYAWVRDSIRYCAIEIGIGGFVPHAADDVESLRYGDCKDKANLLKSLLHIAGVESRLVTIYSSRSPKRFRLPVLAGNFNHAILIVDLPEGPAFVDPTTRTVPFADLPPGDEERECLPLDAVGTDLVMTPASSPDTDHRRVDCTLTGTPAGAASGTCRLEVAGAFADALRGDLLEVPKEQHQKVVAKTLRLRDAKVKTHTGEGLAPPVHPTPAIVDATVSVDLATASKQHPEFLSASTLLESDLLPPLPPSRPAHDVVFLSRRRDDDVVHLKLPASHTVRQLPAPVKVEGPLASFSVAWRAEGDTVVLERSLTIHVVRVPAARVDALRAVVDAWDRASEARVLLQRAPPTAPTTTTTTTTVAPATTETR